MTTTQRISFAPACLAGGRRLVRTGLGYARSGPSFAAGALRIDHPYATPTGAGMVNGAVYFRAIENTGAEPDRLLSASTPIAQSVELHRMQVDDGVMRMRPIEAIGAACQNHGIPAPRPAFAPDADGPATPAGGGQALYSPCV